MTLINMRMTIKEGYNPGEIMSVVRLACITASTKLTTHLFIRIQTYDIDPGVRYSMKAWM